MTSEKKIEELVNKLNYYTKAYDEGAPLISDKEWDSLYFELISLEKETGIYLPNSPTQRVVYEVVNELKKVTHTHLMLSLDKTQDLKEIKSFIGDKNFICMGKMDGLTCTLRYEDGVLVAAATRGNDGIVGEDVLHNILVIKNIPKRIKLKGTIEVDGEVISTYKNFEKFKDKYANPRALAVGSLKLLDASESATRGLSFIAWDWINKPQESLGEALVGLGKLGFTTVPYADGMSLELDNLEEIVNYVTKACADESLPIDGLVFKYDDVRDYEAAGRTNHHFKGGLAYKFYDEAIETHITGIEWSMGRLGSLCPVAIFETKEICGSEVSRASMHNLSILKGLWGDQPGCVGDIVSVKKANMIIPQIVEWKHNGTGEELLIPTTCPLCGSPVSIHTDDESGVQSLWCDNAECDGKVINQITHFCDMKKGMAIKGLSSSTIEKLMDWGWLNSITDLYKLSLHREEWMKKSGFGQRSVDNLLVAIENSKTCELWQVISAIGCPLIGVTASKQLADEFGTWANFYNSIQENFIYSTLPNFGYEMDRAIHEFNKWEELNDIIINFNLQIKEPKEKTNKLEGIIVVITGSLKTYKNRNLFKEAIEAAGGKVAGSVSGNTDYLINNDTTSQSTKNLNAKKLGVDIISEEDFIQKFLT